MKKTKKIISILLAVIMAFSLALPAFAQTGEYGEICETYTFTLKTGDKYSFTFKAPQKGIYYFNLSETIYADDNNGINLYIGDKYELHTSRYDYTEEGNSYFVLDKDETVTVNADRKRTLHDNKTTEFSYSVEYLGGRVLSLGEITIDCGVEYCIFTPDKDGFYNFQSSVSDTMETGVGIMTDNYWRGNPAGIYDESTNFDYTQPLKANEDYIIRFDSEGEADSSGTYTATISYNKDIKSDRVFLHNYEEGFEITMDRYETAEIPLVYLPVSSIYTANVDIAIADESIATAEIKDYELLEITPHKAGKTTITITSDSGKQVSYNIVVEPRIYKILLDIYVFFMSLIGPFFIPLLPFFM